jgi:hypothetical protein
MLPSVTASALLRAWVGALAVTVVGVACVSVPPSPTPTEELGATPAPAAAASPGPASSQDPIAVRLHPNDFSADVVVAAEQALAEAGVGTFDLSQGSTDEPEQPIADPASPMRLTNEQTRSIALDAWSGAGMTGSDLDALVNTPARVAPPSLLLAAYVDLGDTADATAGARVAFDLVGHVDGVQAADTSYPLLVLTLLVGDLTRSMPPETGTASGVLAVNVAGGLCSAVANFVDQSLAAVFNAVRANGSGFLSSLWNIVVTIGQSVVTGLIKALTAPVVETISHIVGVVAIVVNAVSILRPWTVKMQPDDQSTRFSVGGESAIEDAVHLSVDLGGLDSWPPIIADCALAAQITLPDLKPFGAPVSWANPVQIPDPAYPVTPLVTLAAASTLNDTLASDGSAVLRLDTGHEDNDEGDPHTGYVRESATVHRPGLDTLKQSVTGLIVNGLPDIVGGVVASIVSGPIDVIIGKIDALTDASARTSFTVTYHSPKETPAPSASASASASPCGTNGGSIAAGRYTGTVSWSLHDERSVGDTSSTIDISATGPINITVGPTGSISGTWSILEQGKSVTTTGVGTTEVDGSGGVSDGTVGGTTQQMQMQGTVTWTQTLSVNGVAGPPASIPPYPWPYPLVLVPLSTDCGGTITASWQPAAGSQLLIQMHPA